MLAGVATLLAIGITPAAAGASIPRAVEVAHNVWVVQGEAAMGSAANRNFVSNAGFVVTDDGVVVVDALGSPALADELIAEIRRITRLRIPVLSEQPIQHVVSSEPDAC